MKSGRTSKATAPDLVPVLALLSFITARTALGTATVRARRPTTRPTIVEVLHPSDRPAVDAVSLVHIALLLEA